MKIDRIEIRYLQASLDRPFGWSQQWIGARSIIVMKVTTDNGVVGWGETYGSGDSVPGIAAVAKMAIGEDAAGISKIWHKLQRATYQSHVFASAPALAMSAIDTALHDIAGKSAGRPVSEVLGGRLRDSVPVYATGLYYVDDYALAPHLEEATGYAEQGFTGMKMKVGALPLRDDAARIRATREAIGPDIRLMFDANESYDAATALSFAHMVADQDLSWFEEPCASRDDAANKMVQERSPIPIAGGESLATRWEFAPRLATRVFDIIQPDVCSVGGIAEMHRVGVMAQAHGVKINPHYWGTGISLAAALHAMAVQPINQIGQTDLPYQNESVLEFDQTPHPIREKLTQPFAQSESRVPVPTQSGLGIEVDESTVERFAVGEPAIVTA